MLREAQLAHLEHIVHSISTELHIEDATLDAQQTLTLVLCNDTTCFRPLHITAQEVDICSGAGRTAQSSGGAPGMAALSITGSGLEQSTSHASG